MENRETILDNLYLNDLRSIVYHNIKSHKWPDICCMSKEELKIVILEALQHDELKEKILKAIKKK